jgi:hypothetical protein
MLKSSGFFNVFWVEAVLTAKYIQNRWPTTALHKKTPYEACHGSKSSVNGLRIFDCLAYAHKPDEERRKLDDKSKKCIMVGYSLDSKGYQIYDPITHEILVRRDVIFDC